MTEDDSNALVCANNADVEDLYRASALLKDLHPSLSDRLYNSAFAFSYRGEAARRSWSAPRLPGTPSDD